MYKSLLEETYFHLCDHLEVWCNLFSLIFLELLSFHKLYYLHTTFSHFLKHMKVLFGVSFPSFRGMLVHFIIAWLSYAMSLTLFRIVRLDCYFPCSLFITFKTYMNKIIIFYPKPKWTRSIVHKIMSGYSTIEMIPTTLGMSFADLNYQS